MMTNENPLPMMGLNPFPRVTPTRVVLDEECRCGALRTEHGTRFAFGHGACERTGCAQFTWVGMVSVEGMIFETTNEDVYPAGTIVEVIEVGPAEAEDDEENAREPFFWARNAFEDAGHWYFRSTGLRPLTDEARAAHEELVEMERTHKGGRSVTTRPMPF
jgi:hypothetical protein